MTANSSAQFEMETDICQSLFPAAKKVFVKSHSLVSFLPVITARLADTGLVFFPSPNDKSSVWYQ